MTNWEDFKSILMHASALRQSIEKFNSENDEVKIESGKALIVKGIDKIADHFGYDESEIDVIPADLKILKLYDISLLESVDGETV